MDLDECVNCGAGLLSVSDICPQCGWPKNKPIENHDESEEKVENDIAWEQSTIKSTEIKKKIFQPTGVRMLGIFHMVLGVFLIGFAILFASAVMLSVITTAMGSLAGIGSMGSMAMLPGMDSIDPATLSMISGIPSTSVMSIDEMMTIMGATAANASIVIILGIFAVIVGRYLLKGKKWARILIIVFAVISIPITATLLGNLDSLTTLGSFAFDGLVIFYMTKPKVREYFNQTSIEKPIKKSKIKTVQTDEPNPTQVRPSIESNPTQVRPLGVTILVILVALAGTVVVLVGALFSTYAATIGIDAGAYLGVISGGLVILGLATLVTAWGLEKGKPWAWSITRILVAIAVVIDIILQNVVGLIINGVILYYLYRPLVKDYFGKSEQRL